MLLLLLLLMLLLANKEANLVSKMLDMKFIDIPTCYSSVA